MASYGRFCGSSCLKRFTGRGHGFESSVAAAPWRAHRVSAEPQVLQPSSRTYTTSGTTGKAVRNKTTAEEEQAFPLKGFYELLYDIHPAPTRRLTVDDEKNETLQQNQQGSTEERTVSSSGDEKTREQVKDNSTKQGALPQQDSQKELSPRERAGIVFGSRLAGPGYTPSRYRSSSEMPPASSWRLLNGVRIPPRPAEPDNCCMSGCVNCVWDDYRDDVESWAQKVQAAKAAATAKQGQSHTAKKHDIPPSTSMDDDGGASTPYWSTGLSDQDMFGDIPVGIREFMKTEKRLKQRKMANTRQ